MKEFSKYVLATIVGIFATAIIFAVLSLMSVVGMVASSEATQSAPKNSVLVINLNGVINEQSSNDFISQFTGGEMNSMGLDEILSAIKKAKENKNIKGIYLQAGALSTGYATVQEIRNALIQFKKSGKWIVAYGDEFTQGAYYLASCADKIYMNPDGGLDLHGIASQSIYVKDLYAKFGIHYQIIKVGKYKSATEMYSEDHMSDANREQVTQYITGLWQNVVKGISDSRKINPDSINSYADQFTTFMTQKEVMDKKLIDGLLYHDEVKAEIKKRLDIDKDDAISQLSVAQMQNVKDEKSDGEEIAVYYASGNIVDTAVQGFGGMSGSQIVGNEMSADLEDLMNNDDVKAVVIRVNSPGGSAYASEQIWHAVTKLKAKKPVVISMGDYAASGGYYISCNANWIVAQPTTLTGSIGIFGVIPEAKDLLENKLGLHFDGVKTNKHADMMGAAFGFPIRPFDAEETELLQGYINRGYQLFRKRVADGRKQKVEKIEEVAQGHVWLGQDAVGIKLVDELGGLDVAIAKAAKLAKLDEYYTTEYPSQPDWTEQILNVASEGNGNYLDERLHLALGEWYMPFMMMKAATEQTPVQAMMPYYISIK